MIIPQIIILILLQATQVGTAEIKDTALEKYFVPMIVSVVLIIVTNLAQYFAAKKKQTSDANKSDGEGAKANAEAVKALTQTIKEVQTSNNEIFRMFSDIRQQAEKLKDERQDSQDCISESILEIDSILHLKEVKEIQRRLRSLSLKMQKAVIKQ